MLPWDETHSQTYPATVSSVTGIRDCSIDATGAATYSDEAMGCYCGMMGLVPERRRRSRAGVEDQMAGRKRRRRRRRRRKQRRERVSRGVDTARDVAGQVSDIGRDLGLFGRRRGGGGGGGAVDDFAPADAGGMPSWLPYAAGGAAIVGLGLMFAKGG